MRLSEICVERPVFAFMLVMFLVVLPANAVFAATGKRARKFPIRLDEVV